MTEDKSIDSTVTCSYSTVDAHEILDKVVSQYRIDQPLECLLWERGANDTYRVNCAAATYFLRIYRPGAYPLEAMLFEAEFLNYLRQQNVPVAYPVERIDGGYLSEINAPDGKCLALLTSLAPGDTPDYDEPEACSLAGKALARMHVEANTFTTSHQRKHLNLDYLLEESVTVISGHMQQHANVLNIVEPIAQAIRHSVAAVPGDALDFGVCHGDFHGGNLHVHQDTVTLFDFEECAFGYRLYDIATFKWDVCGGSDERNSAAWLAFLIGYESIRPLSNAERSLIETFVVLRELAELAYGIRHVGYFGYNDILAAHPDDVSRRLRKFCGYAGIELPGHS